MGRSFMAIASEPIAKRGEQPEYAKARSESRDSTKTYSEGRARTRQSNRAAQPFLRKVLILKQHAAVLGPANSGDAGRFHFEPLELDLLARNGTALRAQLVGEPA